MKKRSAILAMGLSVLGGVSATSCLGESSVNAPDTQKALADADWYTQPITIDFRGQKLSYEMLCVPSARRGSGPNIVESVGGKRAPSSVGISSFIATVVFDVDGGNLVVNPACFGRINKDTGELKSADPINQAKNTRMTFIDDLENPTIAETIFPVILTTKQADTLASLKKPSNEWTNKYNSFLSEANSPKFRVTYGAMKTLPDSGWDDAMKKRHSEIQALEALTWTSNFRYDETGRINGTDMRSNPPQSEVLIRAGLYDEPILMARSAPIKERYYDFRYEIDPKRGTE